MRRTSWLVAAGVAAVLAVPAGVAAAAPGPTPSPGTSSPAPGSGPGYGPGPGSGQGGSGPRGDCPYWNSAEREEHRQQMIEKYGPDWTPPRDGTGPFHDQAPGRMGQRGATT